MVLREHRVSVSPKAPSGPRRGRAALAAALQVRLPRRAVAPRLGEVEVDELEQRLHVARRGRSRSPSLAQLVHAGPHARRLPRQPPLQVDHREPPHAAHRAAAAAACASRSRRRPPVESPPGLRPAIMISSLAEVGGLQHHPHAVGEAPLGDADLGMARVETTRPGAGARSSSGASEVVSAYAVTARAATESASAASCARWGRAGGVGAR
jgi:hypothetical protein